MTIGERLQSAMGGRVWPGMVGTVPGVRGLVPVIESGTDKILVFNREADTRAGCVVVMGGSEFTPCTRTPGTLEAVQHRAIPHAWRHVGRVAVDVRHTHVYDEDADRLRPAVAVRVLVWADTWRSVYDGDPTVDLAEALTACLESAP